MNATDMVIGSMSTAAPMTQTITTGGGYWADGVWHAYFGDTVYQPYYWHVVEPPRDCAGDVHVFPCPHCDKCKCGAATVKRGKAKK